MDGISIVPALHGNKLKRHTLYGHFPHYVPAVPCRPASWVRDGDWKLIRFYETDEAFPNRLELYNLADDIGELRNLAAVYPERAARMERMLDQQLQETGPSCQRRTRITIPNAARDIAGWHPSGDCWLEQSDAGLVMHCTGGDPFVLTNAVEPASGDLVARFRMKSTSKGGGQFFWTTEKMPRLGPKQRLDFATQHDGNWHDYEVPFTAQSPLRAVRFDPSTAPGKIEIAWIEILTAGDEPRVVKDWQFGKG